MGRNKKFGELTKPIAIRVPASLSEDFKRIFGLIADRVSEGSAKLPEVEKMFLGQPVKAEKTEKTVKRLVASKMKESWKPVIPEQGVGCKNGSFSFIQQRQKQKLGLN